MEVKKSSYKKLGLVGNLGTIKRVSGHLYGIEVDNHYNPNSRYGTFWFTSDEISYCDNEEVEGEVMIDYNKVVLVHIYGDRTTKSYAFKLYDDKCVEGDYVVVDTIRGIQIAKVESIHSVESYSGTTPTREVISIINMKDYNDRVEKRKLEKKTKDRIRRLKKDIKRKIDSITTIKIYEKIAEEYKDIDPELFNMVSELKNLNDNL